MKFNRLNNKHFARLATNNGIFGSAQASSSNTGTTTSDYDQIASLAAFDQGWLQATITSKALPPLEEMQGLESYLSYLINYLYQQGIAIWSSTQVYYVGSMVSVINSQDNKVKLYCSLTNDNLGNDPTTSTDNWEEKVFFDSSFQQTLANKMDRTPSIIRLKGVSGKVNLEANKCYFITPTAAITLVLPNVSAVSNNYFQWIRINLAMSKAVAVDLGTTAFYSGGAPDMADPGSYLILYGSYPVNGVWLCDAIGPNS